MQISDDIKIERNMPSAVALGFFDGIHIGHRLVLNRCVELAKKNNLIPTVFTFNVGDSVPESKKNLTLIHTSEQKNRIFEDIGIEQIISPDFTDFKDFSPEEYIEKVLYKSLNAKILVCGRDHHFGKKGVADVSFLKEYSKQFGIEVVTVDDAILDGAPVSSTRIREAIKNGDVVLAERMLGHSFSIEEPVINGRKIGRTINFPTINQRFPEKFTILKYGVYFTEVECEHGHFCGVTNVGVKPTFNSNDLTCETYILDFNGDLYGKTVKISFKRLLRKEQKFGTIDELRQQISKDIASARKILSNENA